MLLARKRLKIETKSTAIFCRGGNLLHFAFCFKSLRSTLRSRTQFEFSDILGICARIPLITCISSAVGTLDSNVQIVFTASTWRRWFGPNVQLVELRCPQGVDSCVGRLKMRARYLEVSVLHLTQNRTNCTTNCTTKMDGWMDGTTKCMNWVSVTNPPGQNHERQDQRQHLVVAARKRS